MSESDAVDYSARHESFERWFQTPLGRALLADQRRFVDAELQRLTGARQLQVSISHRLPLATGTDFSQKIMTTPRWYPHIPEGVAICDADELAFPGDSMDLVVLHHAADFSPYPHQVIREAARVLRGEGTMALFGFNPLSLWGARKLITRSSEGPWGGRFLLRGRMEDWLNLLPVGAYYCILAKKRVHARLPRRPVWRQSKVIALPGTGTVGASRGCSRSGSSPSKRK